MDCRLLPDTDSAVHDFEENGQHLTIFNSFGEDPLRETPIGLLRARWNFIGDTKTSEIFLYSGKW